MELNVSVAVQMARLVLPGMVTRGYGRIVSLGSKAGRFGSLFTGANYSTSKGANHSLTLQWAQEFGRNCRSPGRCASNTWKRSSR